MKNNKFKKFIKYLAGIFSAGLLISLVILPAFGLNADGPRFNFLKGDNELYTGRNLTKSEDILRDPVDSSVGDEIQGMIYYHNGMVDTVAKNTTIKVNLPNRTTAKVLKSSATISADNAADVSDTIIDGVINGNTGLTVNFDEDAEISVVPGSVKWYPNDSKNENRPSTPLPFNQDGSELFTSEGLNIGDINGCWQYAGFVSFIFKSKSLDNPGISLTKNVRNVSKGETSFVKSTYAEQNETVEFKIIVKNSGNTDLSNLKLTDLLPDELTAKGTFAEIVNDGEQGQILLSDLLSGPAIIKQLKAGKQAIITFKADTPSQISYQKSVYNTAKVVVGDLHDSDSATVIFKEGMAKIVKSKSAYNVTQKVDATKVIAKAGDEILYTLNTKNTGNIDTSYVIEDGIADILEYADFISASNNGGLIGGEIGTNNETLVRYPDTVISAGENIVRTFNVKVKSPIPTTMQNGFHFDYKMFNEYGNEVIICIEVPEVLSPDMSLVKYVRNVSANELEYVKANTAYAGDILEYKIVFKNNGNGSAEYVNISDILPANVSLDTSAAAILGFRGSENSIAENIAGAGYILPSIEPGEKGYIRFRAVIASNTPAGSRLVNTAKMTDDDLTKQDTAETVIKTKIVQVETPPVTLPRTGSADSIILSAIPAALSTILIGRKKAKS